MKLIGMLDSPYVRRTAISLQLLGVPFEHQSLSVFRTYDEFRRINPVVKAPTLVFGRDGTLFFCGNGGSAADAQHLATEYVVRFRRNRRPLRAIALTTDTSLLTAAANDLGFREVFARLVVQLAIGSIP